MTKIHKIYLLILLSLLVVSTLFFQACKTSDDNGDPDGSSVHTDLSIHLMNSNQYGLGGVLITVYGITALTDAVGNASILNVPIPIEEAGRMKILLEKGGFFSNTIGVTPNINGETYTTAILLEKELAGTINNNMGGSLTDQEQQVNVNIAANSYAKTDGSSYSGETKVFIKYIDPSKEDFVLAMPGGADLWAKDESGVEGTLESFGALFMKCETPTGEELIPTPAANFDFCVKIPLNLQVAAPDQIQIWYINENGEWTPYIMAQKMGAEYCFVSNTDGALNCDIFGRSAFLEGTVCDDNFQPASKVRVYADNRIAYTDEFGKFSLLVPANKSLLLKTPSCRKTIPAISESTVQYVTIGCDDEGCDGGFMFDLTVDGQPIDILGGSFTGEDNILMLGGWKDETDMWKIFFEWETVDYDQITVGTYQFGNDIGVWGQLDEANSIAYWAAPSGGTISLTEFIPGFRMKGSFNSLLFIEQYPNQNQSSHILNGTFEVYYYEGSKKQFEIMYK